MLFAILYPSKVRRAVQRPRHIVSFAEHVCRHIYERYIRCLLFDFCIVSNNDDSKIPLSDVCNNDFAECIFMRDISYFCLISTR